MNVNKFFKEKLQTKSKFYSYESFNLIITMPSANLPTLCIYNYMYVYIIPTYKVSLNCVSSIEICWCKIYHTYHNFFCNK